MKIFTWMQNKFNGRHGIKKTSLTSANDHMLQEPQKEEFSDYHHGLLAIGTFGEYNLKDIDQERSNNLEGNLSSSQDHLQDLTLEELGKLQKEFNLSFHEQVESTNCSTESEATNLQLDKLLDRESSLEADQRVQDSNSYSDESKSRDSTGLQRSTSIALNRGKDHICSDNTNKGSIGKKSLYFLLEKMFVCRSGFTPTPSLRDPLPESRMEKILKAILHKKMHPQSSNKSLSIKKYLENRHMPKSSDKDNELNDEADNGSKWLNTDSEYIVLEI